MQPADLKKMIREVPDFPKPGINFYDISTLLQNGKALQAAVDQMAERFKGQPIDAIAGIEARGLVLAASMAYRMQLGLIMVRKFGKLPWKTESESYELEYGQAQLEIHRDAVSQGQRVLVVDDLLATGGTAAASGRLIERLGGSLVGYAFLVELGFLGGRDRLDDGAVFSLLHYE
jgi:adenine phosphoribosyltransferase